MRSVANPELCLDSQVDAGVVVLGTCADEHSKRGDDVRYDLTVQGELLPRWGEGLAVAPIGADAEADIVVKVRDHSGRQRWLTDGVIASPESLSVSGSEAPTPETKPVSRKPDADDDSPAPGAELSGFPAPSASPEAEQGGSILLVGDDTSTGTGGEFATGSGSGPVLPLRSVDILSTSRTF